MNIKNLQLKLDANIYGEQSIVADDLSNFLWTGYVTYVLGRKKDYLYTDRMMDGSEFVIRDPADGYRPDGTFNEEIDFPAISYIKTDYEYDYANQVDYVNTWTTNGNEEVAISLGSVSSLTTDILPTAKVRWDIMITDGVDTWMYVATFESSVSTGVKTTLKPRQITTSGISLNKYKQDTKAPSFFDNLGSIENKFELGVFLPTSFGRTYTISVRLADYVNSRPEAAVTFLGSTVDKGRTISDISIGEQLDPEIPLYDTIDEFGEDIVGLFNRLDADEVQEFYPDFDLYSMSDLEAEEFMAFLTLITNLTTDESTNAAEQDSAYGKFNGDILQFADRVFITTPDEFKKDRTSKRKGTMQSGNRLAGFRY